VTYFFDNCISYRLCEMLRSLGEDVECLRQNHAQNTDDISIFSELSGRSNIVFISTDESQTTRKEEARALRHAGMTALYFAPFFQRMQLWSQAVWILSRWQKIKGFAEGAAQGTCAEIKQNGRAQVFQF
jgi:hypothetical protein